MRERDRESLTADPPRLGLLHFSPIVCLVRLGAAAPPLPRPLTLRRGGLLAARGAGGGHAAGAGLVLGGLDHGGHPHVAGGGGGGGPRAAAVLQGLVLQCCRDKGGGGEGGLELMGVSSCRGVDDPPCGDTVSVLTRAQSPSCCCEGNTYIFVVTSTTMLRNVVFVGFLLRSCYK